MPVERSASLLYALLALSMGVALLVDIALPLGVVVWIVYFVPLVLCVLTRQPVVPLAVAGVATLCIVIGFVASDVHPTFPLEIARLNRILGTVTLWVVALVMRQLVATRVEIERRDWLRAGQAELATVLQGEQTAAQLGASVLRVLCGRLDAPVGVLYVAARDGGFRVAAAHAAAPGTLPERVQPGEGLVGQALADGAVRRIDRLPADYLPLASALGRGSPPHLLVGACTVEGQAQAAVELAFLRPVRPEHEELLRLVAEPIAIAVRSMHFRTRLAELLEETQRQAEELQTQQEELRVANEELEEHNRALRDSEARLEAQQSELEETNAQIEEQSRALEQQRDSLQRVQSDLVERAEDLARANQYKSEFLANMSHELRTPLNSSLILSRLLGENRDGNLTSEQVRYASTIHAACNDLLALINDILDLSRIEAGRLQVDPEPVELGPLLERLERTFRPMAEQKGLAFEVRLEPGTPARLDTDPLRLAQVLRNLLSNALKFTEAGQVALVARGLDGGRLAFAVTDTGVGIARDQHELVFEAFRQASGGTHRRYGGTGLGLTISRELARRLGGDLALQSELGAGSTFTLVVPLALPPEGAGATAATTGTTAGAAPAARASRAGGEPPAGGARAGVAAPPPARVSALAALPAGAIDDDRFVAGFDAGDAAADGAAPSGPGVGSRRETQPSARSDTGRHPGASGAAARGARGDGRGEPRATAHERLPVRRSLLVVEDDVHFAAVLRDLAREQGYRCLVATTVGEAEQLIERFQPSAVLLDVELPDDSGLALLERLKRAPATRHVPVHVVSLSDYTREALELGAVGYVLKPVEREQLQGALARLEQKLDQSIRRVLVVEDSAAQREAILRLLDADGVEVCAVGTGAEALERLRATSWDCVVLDLSLPDMSGYELLDRMAEDEAYAFPPVVVYTGRTLARDDELRLRRYARSIVVKGARSPERLLDEVMLFLHQVESRLPPEQQRILREVRHREAALEGRRVLLVEDDVRNVFALTSVLEPKGARVEIARNGREALAALERLGVGPEGVELVLMDVMMPEMDGLTATREIRLREDWRRLPVIGLTAKAMPDDRQKCLEAGMNDYVAKPLDLDRLLSLVRVWLAK